MTASTADPVGESRPARAARHPARGAGRRASLPEHRHFSRAMQAINRVYARGYHRLTVLAPAHLPPRGPAIIVCNHTSGVDPELIQSCCPRLITWMMAKEYYELPVIRTMLDWLGVIPVSRSGRDMAAMRSAMRALENGQLLGIFPEGRIESGDELLPFQTGIALMAIKTDVPVYAAFLDGTQRRLEILPAFLRRHEARIAFAPRPIEFDRGDTGREGLDRATAAIQAEVERLRQQVLAARPGRRRG